MLNFCIMLYLVPNLARCIAFAKFSTKFGIALENAFYAKMPNFGNGTQIWHCIGDALRLDIGFNFSVQPRKPIFLHETQKPKYTKKNFLAKTFD